MEPSKNKVYKVAVAGEGGSGKTTMLNRLVYREYRTERMTIGTQLHYRNHPYLGKEYWDAIWDFAGEERFRFILKNYMRGADALVLCFDQSRYATFRKLNDWIAALGVAQTPVIKILVGTKSDLQCEIGAIAEDTKAWCERNGFARYMTCSAKSGEGVDGIFDAISEGSLKRGPTEIDLLLGKVRQEPLMNNPAIK